MNWVNRTYLHPLELLCTGSQHILIIYHNGMFTQWTRVLIWTAGIWSFWSMSPLRTWAKLYANFVGFVRGSEDFGFIRWLASLMSVVDIRLSGKSLIYIGSKSGPRIEPCGYSTLYLDPLNTSKAGDFSWDWTLMDFIQAKKDEGKFVVVSPRPPLNIKLGGFTS